MPVTLPFSTGNGSWAMNRLAGGLPVMNSYMAREGELVERHLAMVEAVEDDVPGAAQLGGIVAHARRLARPRR